MAIIPVRDLDGIGIVRDMPPEVLPPNAWTDGKNVRFTDGAVEQIDGESAFGGVAPAAPYFVMSAPEISTQEDSFIVAGLSDVYVYRDGAYTKITRSSGIYNAGDDNRWTGDILGGVAIVNNGVDKPQQWVFPPNASMPLADLTDWSASWSCRVMRAHRNYLIALDVTKSDVRFPYMVKWSDAADPGSVPQSWDITDATRDAGEVNILDGDGFVVDGAELRDQFVIYKEHSTHAMRFVPTTDIFAFYQLFPNYGLLSRNAIGQMYNQHFVVTQSDFIVHDGVTPTPIGDRRISNWFYRAVGASGTGRVFVVPNYRRREMWTCFSQAGDVVPDTAVIWSWQKNSWTVRDLPGCPSIGVGGVTVGTDDGTWNDDGDGTWNDTDAVWYEGQTNLEQQLLMTDPGGLRLRLAGHGRDFVGTNKYSYVERTGIPLGSGTHLHSMKRIQAIWPLMTTRDMRPVEIEVGVHKVSGGPVTWSSPQTFRPWVDRKVNVNLTGVALAVRFSNNVSAGMRVAGYDIDIDEMGTF